MAVTGYITKNALICILPWSGATNVLADVTAINSNPSFKLNGVDVVDWQGPFWADTHLNCPWIFYKFPVDPISTDTVTFSVASGWIFTSAGKYGAITGQTLNNYVGQLEPSAGFFTNIGSGSRQTLAAPGFNDNLTKTLKLGVNASWNANAQRFDHYNFVQNYLKKGSYSNVTQSTTSATGNIYNQAYHPMTISGPSAILAISPADGDVQIDDGMPTPTGVWTVQADETLPAQAMAVAFSVTGAGKIFSSGSSAGLSVSGIEVGKKWWADIGYSSYPPSNLPINVVVTFSKVSAIYPATWTLTNETLVGPYNAGPPPFIDTQTALTPDDVAMQMLTSSGINGLNYPCCVRWVDAVLYLDGQSNLVYPSDLRNLTDFSWAPAQRSQTFSISGIREYQISNSPNVYVDQPYVGTLPSPSGSVAPYYFIAPNNYYFNFSGSNASTSSGGWWIGEVICNSGHGLRTGSVVQFSATGLNNIPVSNGTGNPTVTVSLNNQGGTPAVTICVTDTDKFVVLGFDPDVKHSMPGPQFINNVSGVYTFPGGGTVTNQLPDKASIPYEFTAYTTGKIPGADYWLNIPMSATDDLTAEIARRVRDNLPPGRRVWVEYSNETWSNISSTFMCFALGALGAIIGSGNSVPRHVFYALRAAQHKNTVQTIFNQTDINGVSNRGNEVKLVIAGQFDGGNLGAILLGANSGNATNPIVPVAVDAFATAPYLVAPNDTTLAQVCSSIYTNNYNNFPGANGTTIKAAGTSITGYPINVPQWIDIIRHYVKYTSLLNGAAGDYQTNIQQIATYIPASGQAVGYVPDLVGYEAAMKSFIPFPITTAPTSGYLMHIATHDVFYNKDYYHLENTLYQTSQLYGFKFHNQYALCFGRTAPATNLLTVTMFGQYNHAGQLAGYGSGNTQYDFSNPTNGSQDFRNDSVRAQAFLDWLGGSSDTGVMLLSSSTYFNNDGNFILNDGKITAGGATFDCGASYTENAVRKRTSLSPYIGDGNLTVNGARISPNPIINNRILLESGFSILYEDDGSLLQEAPNPLTSAAPFINDGNFSCSIYPFSSNGILLESGFNLLEENDYDLLLERSNSPNSNLIFINDGNYGQLAGKLNRGSVDFVGDGLFNIQSIRGRTSASPYINDGNFNLSMRTNFGGNISFINEGIYRQEDGKINQGQLSFNAEAIFIQAFLPSPPAPVDFILEPTDIPNCFLWLEGASATGVVGTTVNTWYDFSGSGNHVSVGSSPTLVNGAINGYPAVSFSNGNYLRTPTNNQSLNISPSSITLFSVFNVSGYGGTGKTICSIFNASDTGTCFSHGVGFSNASGLYWDWGAGYAVGGVKAYNTLQANGYTTAWHGTNLIPPNQWMLTHNRFRVDNQFAFGLYGVDIGTGIANTNVSSNNLFYMGAGYNNISGSPALGATFGGMIAEVVGYNRKLTSIEVEQVNTYLMLKYSLNNQRMYLYTKGRTNPHTSGTFPLYTSGPFSASGNSGIYASRPMFLMNDGYHNSIFLYLGAGTEDMPSNSLPLYINTPSLTSYIEDSTTLYVHNGISETGSFPQTLFIAGYGELDGGSIASSTMFPLYIQRGEANVVPLYIMGGSSSSGNIPMSVSGVYQITDNRTLYTSGQGISGNIPLYVAAPTNLMQAVNFYVSGIPTERKTTKLFTRGFGR